MGWLALALLSAFTLAVQSLGFKSLSKRFPIPPYMFYVWFGAAALLAMVYGGQLSHVRPGSARWLVVAGMASWAGTYAYNLGVRREENLGYVEAIVSLRAVMVYCFSVAVSTNVEVSAGKGLAVVGTILAVALISSGRQSAECSADPNPLFFNLGLAWCLISALMYALLIVATRYALEAGTSAEIATFWILAVSAACFLVNSVVRGQAKYFVTVVKIAPGLVLLTASTGAVGSVSLYAAVGLANNPGLPAAVTNSRFALLYVTSVLWAGATFRLDKLAGVTLMIVSVLAIGV